MVQIVIVDDEPIIVHGLSKLISRFGSPFQIVGSFTKSEEALTFILQNHADILITDIRMPQVDGLTLITKARSINQELRCIILSGYSEFEYARSAVKLGVVDYLLKPVDDQELHNILFGICPQHPVQSAKYIHKDYSRDVSYLKNEIEINYARFNLDVCADKLGKSRDYLCRLYKKETGINLPEYLKQVRIEQSKILLEQNDGCKIYEISELVGFTNTVHFAKQFKKYVGVSPKDY